jgi:microcystin-dependent protein
MSYTINNVSIVSPTGSVIAYTGTSSPSGWLLCDGSSVLKTTYSNLYAVIGYTFGGAGDTFSLPDYTGRFLFGGASTSSINASVDATNLDSYSGSVDTKLTVSSTPTTTTGEFYYQVYADGSKTTAITAITVASSGSLTSGSVTLPSATFVPNSYSINYIIKY